MSVKLNEYLQNEHTSTAIIQREKLNITTKQKAFLVSRSSLVPTLISKKITVPRLLPPGLLGLTFILHKRNYVGLFK